MNLAISIAVGLATFVVACFTAMHVVPSRRGSTPNTIRAAASCLLSVVVALLLYVYLED